MKIQKQKFTMREMALVERLEDSTDLLKSCVAGTYLGDNDTLRQIAENEATIRRLGRSDIFPKSDYL